VLLCCARKEPEETPSLSWTLSPPAAQAHSKHIPSAFQAHAKHIPSAFQAHSMHIPSTCRTHSKRIPSAFQAHSTRIPSAFQAHAEPIPRAFHAHSKHMLPSTYRQGHTAKHTPSMMCLRACVRVVGWLLGFTVVVVGAHIASPSLWPRDSRAASLALAHWNIATGGAHARGRSSAYGARAYVRKCACKCVCARVCVSVCGVFHVCMCMCFSESVCIYGSNIKCACVCMENKKCA
jgi:hypothetical protein